MNINLYDVIIIILSSSVVAGLVTLMLGHILDNKKYIKDKKMAAYMELIEKIDEIFPAETIFKKTTGTSKQQL